MAKNSSAGILVYRFPHTAIEFFLVHPGGPFWKNKDEGAWTIPKGEFTEEEQPLDAARREFREETGIKIDGKFRPLNPVRQKSGKWVYAWAIESDPDPGTIQSNMFEIEWPPRTGKKASFPEVDRAAWFGLDDARKKINPAQVGLLVETIGIVSAD